MDGAYALRDLPNHIDDPKSKTYDVADYIRDGKDRESLIAAAERNDVKEAAKLLKRYKVPSDGDTSTDKDDFTYTFKHVLASKSKTPGNGSNQPPAGNGQRHGSGQPLLLQLLVLAIEQRKTILIVALIAVFGYLLSKESSSSK
ncbi:uncharacterized protein LOC113319280 isoform X2 [Papaver somniferum]|uniref:uncharacterized protein LOC113319280 isoform X2 n=1 Tax=Papaver somniferum TaxID=3469 RepID=UPI000E6F9775|nr:uncharacterized protein LOC113319280 isoform X2 [Papaver somniferum]